MAELITYDMCKERLSFDKNGNLTRTIRYHWQRKNDEHKYDFDVVKENENGKAFCRNFCVCWFMGKRFYFYAPHKSYRSYYQGIDTRNKPYGIDKWGSLEQKYIRDMDAKQTQTSDEIKQLLLSNEKTREFALYVFDYLPTKTAHDTLIYYKVWKEHKETELLLKMGYYKLPLCKGFWRIAKAKKKDFIRFLQVYSNNNRHKYKTYTELLYAQKGIDDMYLYKKCDNNNEIYNYLIDKYSHNCGIAEKYKSYKDMLSKTHHDINDKYWLFPKDFDKAYEDVYKEYDALRNKSMNEQLQNAVRNTQEKLIGGYKLYIANNLSDIKKQANELHQCLISNSYEKKVADFKILLLFIRDLNDKPIATCELDRKTKEIGQFYCDESVRNNCCPSDDLKQIMNTYINQIDYSSICYA